MKKSGNILSKVACSSLMFIGVNCSLAVASDAETVYKDASSNSLVTEGKMQVLTNKTLTSLQTDIAASSTYGCSISTTQNIDLDSKNYRWHNEDVSSQFIDPAYKLHKLRYAKLCVQYNDVDLTSAGAYTPELDVVQFGQTTIGVLPGENGATQLKCWDVTKRVESSLASHIPFIINVDAAHNRNHWAVYLHNAKLSTCHTPAFKIPPFPIDPRLPLDPRLDPR